MTDSTAHRLLRAILASPDAVPCGHMKHLATYLAASPVKILLSENDDEEPALDCDSCEVTITWRRFAKLIAGAAQERN